MKILLVNPSPWSNINSRLAQSVNRAQGIYPPLGLAYNAAILEQNGHEVKILDCYAENLTEQQTLSRIKKFSPDLVGVYAMTPLVQEAYKISRMAKQQGITTVIGGPQMFAYPAETVSNPSIDYGIAWEGEISFPQFTDFLEKKARINEVEGLVYKQGKRIKQNPGRTLAKLDELPFPARHLLKNNLYGSILSKRPYTTTMTSRGCPYHCDYCFKPPTENRMRFRSGKNVADEIEHCIKKYGTREIWFYDDTFTINRKHVREVCKEILKRRIKISWQAPTRVDVLDENTLKLMKQAGCEMLRLGIESGDEETLKLMNKKTSLKIIKNAVRMLKQTDIKIFGFFMLGYPGETLKSMEKTIKLPRELDLDWAMFSKVTPFPKTPLYEKCLKQGLINDYWKEFTLEKTEHKMMDVYPEAGRKVDQAFKQFYLRPSYFVKKIKELGEPGKFFQYVKGLKAIMMFEQ